MVTPRSAARRRRFEREQREVAGAAAEVADQDRRRPGESLLVGIRGGDRLVLEDRVADSGVASSASRRRSIARLSCSSLRAMVKCTGRPTIARVGSGPRLSSPDLTSRWMIRAMSCGSVRCRPPIAVPVKLASPRYAFSDWRNRPLCVALRVLFHGQRPGEHVLPSTNRFWLEIQDRPERFRRTGRCPELRQPRCRCAVDQRDRTVRGAEIDPERSSQAPIIPASLDTLEGRARVYYAPDHRSVSMPRVLSRLNRIVPLLACAVLIGATARAEVTRVDIRSKADALGGRAFGDTGAYEVLSGTIHFAVDPASPRNQVIVDLDKAPRNQQGLVEFSSDIAVLRPKDPSKGNGVLFFEAVNRGNKSLLQVFSHAARGTDFTSEKEFGDAWLLKQGYTLVFVGWQFDIAPGKALVGFSAPIATENGAPIKGWVRMPFISDKALASYQYGSGYNTATYLPLNTQDRTYRLTVREGTFAPPRLIPRDEWEFARVDGANVVADPASVHLKSGFKPGLTYELSFETQNPPVAGLGMAAIRDAASAFKYGTNQVASGRLAYLYGASQTGRLIRQMIHEGFTIDASGRKAFDAAFIQTGAVGFGSFNERFAQPNELGSIHADEVPVPLPDDVDPVTGREDGLGNGFPAGLEPKLFLVDVLRGLGPRACGGNASHGDGRVGRSPGCAECARLPTCRNEAWGWVVSARRQRRPVSGEHQRLPVGAARTDGRTRRLGADGCRAAAEHAPNLHDATLVAHKELRFPSIPGLQQPTFVPGGYRADVPSAYSAMPFLLPKVDADGNDVAGIRLPIVSVPLGTLTGWQFRSPRSALRRHSLRWPVRSSSFPKPGQTASAQRPAPLDSGAVWIARRVCEAGPGGSHEAGRSAARSQRGRAADHR